jgi:peptide/nickel transport system permease protein
MTSMSETKRVLKILIKNPLSIAGFIIVLVFFVIAAFAPLLVPYPQDIMGGVRVKYRHLPPSAQHPFGTDEVGRDLFSRVLYGTRISLQIGVIVIGVGAGIGVPLGLIAGFFGGWIEQLIMRVTDVFLAVPGILLAIAIVSVLGPGITNAMIALSLVWWQGYVRLIYGKVKAIREESYVEAGRAIGLSSWRIMFRHVLPNCASPFLVKASMDMGMAILHAAGLGFIGIGAQPPMPEWGAIISEGRRYLSVAWWHATFPGLAIWLTVLGFNFLGDALRDALDPKTRTQILR